MKRNKRHWTGPRSAGLLMKYSVFGLLILGLCYCTVLTKPKSEEDRASSFFKADCGKCHDSDAEGDGQFHSKFIPPPSNLTLIHDTPSMFKSIVANGVPGTAMPKVPIGDSLIEGIIKFVADQPPETSIEWEVPWEIRDKNPDTEYGSKLYVTACAGCHGTIGDGSGQWAQDPRIWPKPANFHARNSDMGRIFFLINNGREGTMMPPHTGRLTPYAGWALAGYVYDFYKPDSLSEIPVPSDKPKEYKNKFSENDEDAVKQGEQVFELHCTGCHNAQGKGSFLAPSLIDLDWMYGKGTDNDLFIILDKGLPGRLMPSFQALDEDTRWTVVSYLRHRGGLKDPREF